MTVVVDASVVAALWLDRDASGALVGQLRGESLHAPEQLLVEVTNVLRRRRNAGLLSRDDARAAFTGVMSVPAQLWPFASVAARVWELGANASAYDAAHLALAERLDAPLLTRDARLARVPGARCAVEVL